MSIYFKQRLQNKRILITGGSGALGAALCREFVRQGAIIGFTYFLSENKAHELLVTLHQTQPGCRSWSMNVCDRNQVESTVTSMISDLGGIDVLINNAGLTQILPLALMEENDWDKVMDGNAKGTYLVSRAVLPHMVRQRHGSILNMSSLAGIRILEAPVHYCASKAAIKGFTESLSKEVGRYNIRVNCLAPGLLNQGVAENIPSYKLERYLKQTALGRVGSVEEIAKFAAFMVSDANSYMTGATVTMDGAL